LEQQSIAVLLLVFTIAAISYKGLNHVYFFEAYKFHVDSILIDKEFKRLLTSGFLHVNWMHLIFNLLSLFSFAVFLEFSLGSTQLLLLYFTSLIGGNLFALFIHRQHGDYSAAGASGAISGLIFATIALFPHEEIGLIMLPVYVPCWLFGLIFIAFSIYGIKSKKDNIGHEAHLGGGIIGMLVALVFVPHAVVENYLPLLAITLPVLAFIFIIITRPQFLLIDNLFKKTHQDHYSIDHKYNAQKTNKQKELDLLLDKINSKGFEHLTSKEKQKLSDHSKSN
jgi:membrane associated rhomboid family serine protease